VHISTLGIKGTGHRMTASGCAMVLDAARAIAQLNTAPRRSIRFVLWEAKNRVCLDRWTTVHLHASEMGKCIAVITTVWEPVFRKVDRQRERQSEKSSAAYGSVLIGLGG